jgi:cell division transport system permease protein
MLLYNVNIMVEDLNKTNEVMVYIDSSLSDAEARSIGTKINQITNVHNSVFVSREEALDKFVKDHADSGEAFAGVVASDLRHRFVVTLMDNVHMKETVDNIRRIPGVADIKAEYELAEGFITIQNVLRIVSIGIIGVLLVVSLLIISNTVKLALYDRKEEIGIMKMVGATNGFIRLPFVVEGFTLGMSGAVIAFGLNWFLYDMLIKTVEEADYMLKLFNFVPFEQMLIPMVATFGAAGMFVGVVGSWASIRKFLDV